MRDTHATYEKATEERARREAGRSRMLFVAILMMSFIALGLWAFGSATAPMASATASETPLVTHGAAASGRAEANDG